MRKALVEKAHKQLSVRRQSQLLGINRNRLRAARPGGIKENEQSHARHIDTLHTQHPELGARRISHWLTRQGQAISRRKVTRLMKHMAIAAIYRKPNSSKAHPKHKIYPYLLRNKSITQADEVWCADITYIPLARGYGYLCAIMDWHSRAVLGWQLSNTLGSNFCVEAFHQALRTAARPPKILNTDQGSQFSSQPWTQALQAQGVSISMDGKGRWMDNVLIERLWRSVKHEGIYLWAHNNLHEVHHALEDWFKTYNHYKPHRSHNMQTPWQIYRPQQPTPWSLAA